jgi:peptidoglycan/xylan/chitin deacetylase (PgdA/CDA1 family)
MDRSHAAVHLDLDGGAHIFRAHRWRYEEPDDFLFKTGLCNALDFFDEAGVRATLFVIAEDVGDAHKRSLLREAVQRGHEIASHSLTHRKLTTLDRAEKRREIFDSREALAQSLGVAVAGFRAPGFDIDREALQMIAEAGYRYDSSLFPTADFARRTGVAEVSALPHYPLPDSSLIELPLPGYRPLPWPFHPSYSLVLGTWYFRLGLLSFRRNHAPLVLLFHLTDFAQPLRQSILPNRRARLFTLSHLGSEAKRHRCRQMLELVAGEYRLTQTAELLNQPNR